MSVRRLYYPWPFANMHFLVGSSTTVCPVCEMSVDGSLDEVKEHVDACLRVDREPSEHDVIDVEDDDYDEYEWAGQRRVRATSLFRGGMRGAGFLTIQRTGEDEELDVTGDGEGESIGEAQYTDMDIVPMSAETTQEDIERRLLREAVIGVAHTNNRQEVVNNDHEDDKAGRDDSRNKSSTSSMKQEVSESISGSEVSLLRCENQRLRDCLLYTSDAADE